MMGFEYVLPVIRGIQGEREYYVSMCPLGILPKLFPLPDERITPFQRSQRRLNKSRSKKICQYILENRYNYVFSAITASIDADTTFEAVGEVAEMRKLGRLRIPMEGSLRIHDGLHRRVALEMALRANPQLKYETIPVILYIDTGLPQCQQLFIDLNRWGVKLPLSLTILYDNRNAIALMVQKVAKTLKFFNDYTYLDGDRIPKTSDKLLTLTQLYQATIELLRDVALEDDTQNIDFVLSYWQEVIHYLEANKNDENFDKLLLRLGKFGRLLLTNYPNSWKEKLQGLNVSELLLSGQTFLDDDVLK
ncbi:DNA sulfur modification protein DndB [Cyanothece sp. BG0011]|uniref:DNA sulfur modification protein DndB n=1 Tax=Cyanothece sp. BG0011 TaxID=2082950 RepID=UPI0018E55A65|nr:DNA sulfur modification protein DndB [Cyanothece sp. BG0011]